MSGLEVIKLLMLNSTEHEMYPAHKCSNAGILTFISRINTSPKSLNAKNAHLFQRFSFYEQLKFRVSKQYWSVYPKNHKATKPACNVGPHRPVRETSFKRRFAGGPTMARF